jgi:hypothetical protein
VVANRTRAEELAAAETVARTLGVERPVPADINGEADLIFTAQDGGNAAVEVTFLTDATIKVANAAWMAERARAHYVASLRQSWTVTVEIREATFRRLAARLEPHLAVLERHGIDTIDRWSWHRIAAPAVLEALRALVELGVVQARVSPARDPSLRHIFISPMDGYHAKGSDAALEIIERYLGEKNDNLAKLAAAGVEQRHLFLWLDGDTPGAVSRPFTGGSVAEWDHFGLPTRPPALPEPITDLWVAHRSTHQGWYWPSRGPWQRLDESWREEESPAAGPTRHPA